MQKLVVAKMRQTSSITMTSLVEIVCHMLAVFCSCHTFGITEFMKMEMLLSSIISKILLVPLHRGRILVVHLYSSFYMDPGFSSRGKFIPKIANFVRSKPIFLKP